MAGNKGTDLLVLFLMRKEREKRKKVRKRM